MVDAAGAEPSLRDHEAVALARDQVAGRHAHVFEEDFRVPLMVLVAEHRQAPHDLHAGRIAGHEDHALLAMARTLGVGLAHHDHDAEVGMQRA